MSDDTLTKKRLAGWKPTHSYFIAALCLLLGMAGGYLARGLSRQNVMGPTVSASAVPTQTPSPSANAAPTNQTPPPSPNAGYGQMAPQDLQRAVAQQLPPLLGRLKSDPKNADLLAAVGNMYFDARQYRNAITYYGRVLRIQPLNTLVRTDLGNAYWYLGNADRAIAEFKTALKTDPNQANVLFDLGIVQWKGKKDAKAAIATWQKLLDTNPSFEGKEMVVRLMAQTKQQTGTKTDNPAI